MDSDTRNKLIKAIMTILGILVAAAVGFLAGCSLSWKPDHMTAKLLWPDRPIELRLGVGAETRPAPDSKP